MTLFLYVSRGALRARLKRQAGAKSTQPHTPATNPLADSTSLEKLNGGGGGSPERAPQPRRAGRARTAGRIVPERRAAHRAARCSARAQGCATDKCPPAACEPRAAPEARRGGRAARTQDAQPPRRGAERPSQSARDERARVAAAGRAAGKGGMRRERRAEGCPRPRPPEHVR